MSDSDATTAVPPEVAFLERLMADNNYSDARPIGDGLFVAISPFFFTHGIIVGEIGDAFGYIDRWCFHCYAAAKAALDAWDGQGEPEGWHRHPASGRRVAQSDDEFDDDGQPVRKGDLYRRG